MQVEIGAHVEAADAVFDQRAGTEHQDRHGVAFAADRLADGVAAHAGQHQVENDEVDRRGVLLKQCERRRPVADRGHQIALGLKIVLDADGQVLFVFDDQDMVHGDFVDEDN